MDQTIQTGKALGVLHVVGQRQRKSDFSTLPVVRKTRTAEPVDVWKVRCTCKEVNCPVEVDMDVQLLHQTYEACPLQGIHLYPYSQWTKIVQEAGIDSREAYHAALVSPLSKLPKGLPLNPEDYPEWQRWGVALNKEGYWSRKETLVKIRELLLTADFSRLPSCMIEDILDGYRTVLEAAKQYTDIDPDGLDHPDFKAGLTAIEDELDRQVNGFEPEEEYRPEFIPPTSVQSLEEGLRCLSEAPQGSWRREEFAENMYAGIRHLFWQTADKLGLETAIEKLALYEESGGSAFKDSIADPLREEVKAIQTFGDIGKMSASSIRLSQKYSVYFGLNHKVMFVTSGTGNGKSRVIPLMSHAKKIHVTVIVAPLGTIVKNYRNGQAVPSQWEREILSVEHKSEVRILNSLPDPSRLKETIRYYLLLNPEDFQQGNDELDNKLRAYNIGLFCIDEFQNFLAKTDDGLTQRYKRMTSVLRSLPLDCHTVAMSATPFRTDVEEPRSALRLMTGENFDHLEGTLSTSIGRKTFVEFQKRGVRFENKGLPERKMIYVPIHASQECIDAVEKGTTALAKSFAMIQEYKKALADFPLNGDDVHRHPLHYSEHVDTENNYAITRELKAICNSRFECTGAADGWGDWIMACSKQEGSSIIIGVPAAAGRDGAHKHSNTLFIWDTPPTYGTLHQLFGRVHRPNSAFDTCYIYWPIALNVEWDVGRYKEIHKRRRYLELVVQGHPNLESYPTEDQLALLPDARKRIIEELSVDLPPVLEMNPMQVEETPQPRNDYQNTSWKNPATIVHSKFTIPNCDPVKLLHKLETGLIKDFNGQPVSLNLYFETLEHNKQDWTEDPQDSVLRRIQREQPGEPVCVLGSGENTYDFLPSGTKYVDLFAARMLELKGISSEIIKRSLDDTGLPSASFNAVTAALCLYKPLARRGIAEIHRLLKPGGKAYIVRPDRKTSKWTQESLFGWLEAQGFIGVQEERRHHFIYWTVTKPLEAL